jgi:small subunit ribosomal protein S2
VTGTFDYTADLTSSGRLALPRAATPFLALQQRRSLVTETPSSVQISTEDASNLPQSASSRPQAIVDPKDTTVEDWDFFQHQKKHTTGLGNIPVQHYKPHELLANPPKPQDVTLELLMASQSHLGHATSLWNPMNAKYIFGIRGEQDPIHIISLDVTASHLRRACKIVEGVAARGGLILFVGTRDGQARAVVKAAEMAGGCHLFDKWTPGTLTNGQQILGRCKKKVVNELDREQHGFEPQLKHSAAIKPDLVVCLNPLENYVLLHECGIHNIPTIGIIDTDANPTWVTYPIPANDDSLRCVQVLAGALGRAGEAGQARRLADARTGHINYEPRHGLEMPTKEEVEASKRGEEGANSQHDEVEEVFDDEIQEAEHEDEPDAYALRMEEAAKERELMARATPSVDRDDQLGSLLDLDEENFDEDIAQFSQPELDVYSQGRGGVTNPRQK